MGLLGWLQGAKVAPADTPEGVTLEAFPEREEIPKSERNKKFPVLIRVTAPKASDSTNVDLVAVLDMSASMTREGLQHVKQAMLAVVNNLGPEDRFSVLPFSSKVQDRTELTKMNLDGKQAAITVVHNLVAGGKTDMGAALQQAAKILKERKKDGSVNRECFIIFISAGKDDSVYTQPINDEFPVHTIGLVLDKEYDTNVMSHIANSTGGTYSFIYRDMNNLGSTLEKLIQNQKSVGAKNMKIELSTPDGITISSIESGGHKNNVTKNQESGVIEINRLYAGHVSKFIVYLRFKGEERPSFIKTFNPPKVSEMKLMTVDITNQEGILNKVDVSVRRSEKSSSRKVCPLVAEEVSRLELVRRISDLAKKPTADGLERMWNEFLTSGENRMYSKWKFEHDISEMQKGISDADKHKMQGLPYMLSWLSSHNWQRATAKGSPHIPDNFLPTSTMEEEPEPELELELEPEPEPEHTMFSTTLLLLPSAISDLVILILAIFFGFHTGIMNMWQSLHLRMVSITVTAVINYVMQHLYSALIYSSILESFSALFRKKLFQQSLYSGRKLRDWRERNVKYLNLLT